MTTSTVTRRARRGTKPAKPRKDFPLFAHASGQWAKKVRGKLFYFGTWDDPVAAEKKWDRDKQALLEGRNPDESTHGDSIGWLCNVFLDSKELQRQRGELTQRTFDDYRRVAKHVAEHFGRSRRLDSIRSGDIERYRNGLPDTWGPVSVNNHLRMCRVLFRYGNAIDACSIKYEIGLKQVPRSTMRKHAAGKPSKEFTAAEIWRLHDAADEPMRAFVLLGINCGYGTADIGRLKVSDVDLENRWLGVMRGKTGIARGAWLWPETAKALREAIDSHRWTGNEGLDKLAFLTRQGRPWYVDGSTSHPLTAAFTKLKEQAGIDKPNVGHYSLRHTFETIAGDSKDQPAVDFVMGHMDSSIQGNYREGIDPKRVIAVCKHVRKWWLAGRPKKRRVRR